MSQRFIKFIRSIRSIKSVKSVDPCGALYSRQPRLPLNTVRRTPKTLWTRVNAFFMRLPGKGGFVS